MKNIKLLVIPIFALALLLSCYSMTAQAEETEYTYTYDFYFEYYADSGNPSGSINKAENCVIQSNWPVIAYYDEKYPGRDYEEHVRLVALNLDNIAEEFSYTFEGDINKYDSTGEYQYKFSDVGYSCFIKSIKNATDFLRLADSLDNHYVGINYKMTVPLFDSKESAYNYITNNDTSGLLNKDWSSEHDFSKDTYSLDIPIPEVSHITHKGFTLSNIEEGLYIDVIVENRILEMDIYVKNYSEDGISPGAVPSYVVAPLINETYAKNRWNFTTSHQAFSQSEVDIAELYGVDIQSALIDLYKQWSEEHPTIKTLDNYNWKHIGLADDYKETVYSSNSNLSDEQQLKNSKQGETTYYIRYYNKNAVYGQWAKYVLNDFKYDTYGNKIEGSTVHSGTVTVNPEGKVEVTGKEEGEIDEDSGSISYKPYVPKTPSTDMDLTSFKGILESITDSINDFPILIAKLFGFFPSWLVGLIAVAIACCVLLRFLGR